MADTKTKKPRKLKKAKYQAFKLQKRIKPVRKPLPNVIALSRQTLGILKRNKRFFAVYTLLYGVLSFIFIQAGSSALNLSATKELLAGNMSGLAEGVILYTGLVGSSMQFNDQVASLYQFVFIIIFGLAIVYGLRHMFGKEARKVTIKESLYKGMTPLIPVLLVLLVLVIMLLPFSIGSSIYATVLTTGIAATNIERMIWLIFVLLTGVLSLYLLSGSLFALFIVTLPDMTPVRALRASRELVRFRRMQVIRKLLFLPFALLIVMGIVLVPLILLLPVAAQITYFILSALVLPIIIAYAYNLYRSML